MGATIYRPSLFIKASLVTYLLLADVLDLLTELTPAPAWCLQHSASCSKGERRDELLAAFGFGFGFGVRGRLRVLRVGVGVRVMKRAMNEFQSQGTEHS